MKLCEEIRGFSLKIDVENVKISDFATQKKCSKRVAGRHGVFHMAGEIKEIHQNIKDVKVFHPLLIEECPSDKKPFH